MLKIGVPTLGVGQQPRSPLTHRCDRVHSWAPSCGPVARQPLGYPSRVLCILAWQRIQVESVRFLVCVKPRKKGTLRQRIHELGLPDAKTMRISSLGPWSVPSCFSGLRSPMSTYLTCTGISLPRGPSGTGIQGTDQLHDGHTMACVRKRHRS